MINILIRLSPTKYFDFRPKIFFFEYGFYLLYELEFNQCYGSTLIKNNYCIMIWMRRWFMIAGDMFV